LKKCIQSISVNSLFLVEAQLYVSDQYQNTKKMTYSMYRAVAFYHKVPRKKYNACIMRTSLSKDINTRIPNKTKYLYEFDSKGKNNKLENTFQYKQFEKILELFYEFNLAQFKVKFTRENCFKEIFMNVAAKDSFKKLVLNEAQPIETPFCQFMGTYNAIWRSKQKYLNWKNKNSREVLVKLIGNLHGCDISKKFLDDLITYITKSPLSIDLVKIFPKLCNKQSASSEFYMLKILLDIYYQLYIYTKCRDAGGEQLFGSVRKGHAKYDKASFIMKKIDQVSEDFHEDKVGNWSEKIRDLYIKTYKTIFISYCKEIDDYKLTNKNTRFLEVLRAFSQSFSIKGKRYLSYNKYASNIKGLASQSAGGKK
ncbi:MAG: hypothetical protein AAGA27_08505, partial [Pseudomonadota bacterium]